MTPALYALTLGTFITLFVACLLAAVERSVADWWHRRQERRFAVSITSRLRDVTTPSVSTNVRGWSRTRTT